MKKPGAITVTIKNGVPWIVLPDSITMDNYVRIEEEVMEAAAGPNLSIVLDMAATRTLFSSGLGVLIRLKKRLDEKKRRLYLVNVSRRVQDIFASVRLDKVFLVFATDVEFEISQEDILENRRQSRPGEFLFIERVEKGIRRIGLSGACRGGGADMARLAEFSPDPKAPTHVIDLTGLDMIDTGGVQVLTRLFVRIRDMGGSVITYGGDEFIKDLLDTLTLSEFIKSFSNEREAMKAAVAG